MTDDDKDIRRAMRMDEDEILRLIAERRNDTAFMERLRASIERNKAILDRLAAK